MASMTEFKSIYFLTAGGHYCFNPRIDEAKSLLAFIVLLILSLSLKLSVWISELFVNTAPWEKTRMIKEEIGRIANTYFEVLMCIKTKDTKQKTRMIKEEI